MVEFEVMTLNIYYTMLHYYLNLWIEDLVLRVAGERWKMFSEAGNHRVGTQTI